MREPSQTADEIEQYTDLAHDIGDLLDGFAGGVFDATVKLAQLTAYREQAEQAPVGAVLHYDTAGLGQCGDAHVESLAVLVEHLLGVAARLRESTD